MKPKQTLHACVLAIVTVLVGSGIILGQHRGSSRGSSSLTLKACTLPGEELPAQCGSYEVFENRTTKTGRRIGLNVVVIPATGSQKEPDPMAYFAGGPGSAATEEAAWLAKDFASILQKRDLLLVDQRGTGKSHPLNCELFNPGDLQSYLGYFFPLEAVKKCRQQLEAKADLALYTTEIAMDDLDEVRAALGYEKLNLFGASYGTRAALTYLKRHPKHVRTVTLQGVSPTNHYIPMDFAAQTERALQGVIEECLADNDCGETFPRLRAETKSVLDQLLKGPVEVVVKSSTPGNEGGARQTRVRLSRDLAAEAIRYMLYNPRPAGRLPLVLHLAAQGNYVPLAEAALRFRENIVASGSTGMYLSVTCAEDLPWVKAADVDRLSANTFLGDYRFRDQREACALWPQGSISADYAKPVRSALPILILSGKWDPVTPPENGDGVARHLTNSLHVVVPHGAHGFGGLVGTDCLQRLVADFVKRGTKKGLDTGCVSGIKRQGWTLTQAQ
ncbi:MAG TPA: alpha/beta fold hydrolase [Pyrinomonadaceae bacterium]|nr:alpha/beta fold hydrolase [Pyrinomonadaceae bacterium]